MHTMHHTHMYAATHRSAAASLDPGGGDGSELQSVATAQPHYRANLHVANVRGQGEMRKERTLAALVSLSPDSPTQMFSTSLCTRTSFMG
jgi:hypothetical protein